VKEWALQRDKMEGKDKPRDDWSVKRQPEARANPTTAIYRKEFKVQAKFPLWGCLPPGLSPPQRRTSHNSSIRPIVFSSKTSQAKGYCPKTQHIASL
jgi:hypothetical protein